MNEEACDILIVGGGTGGVAAAIAVARAAPDLSVVVVEPTSRLGGQLTTQAVPPDENRWIEHDGGTRLYQELRSRVRDWYRVNRPLTPAARADAALNPGGGWVSRLCAEPRVWELVLGSMLAEHVSRGNVRVLTRHRVVGCDVERDAVLAVTVRSPDSGQTLTLRPRLVLDASEWGDVLDLAKVEHAIGAEGRSVYGELHAPAANDLRDQQACSWCFALEHVPGENFAGPAPANYDFWRSFTPAMAAGEPAWCGLLFSWTVPSHSPEGKRTFRLIPWPDEPPRGPDGVPEWEMWRYRRITDAGLYAENPRDERGRPCWPDISLINMVQMDYWQKPLLGVDESKHAAALAGAREQSLCWLHWMRTEAPRHDGRGLGYPGLKLRGDEIGTGDGFAEHVYVREPRRLLARTVVHEGHLGTDQRQREGRATRELNWDATPYGTAERFADSIGIGHYPIDLHPSCSGRNSVYVPAAPYRIPMGAIIPVRVRNVLAAGKCLGVSHIVNGTTRMHHSEWNIGESAGLLAAACVRSGLEPAAVHADPKHVADVQRLLVERGVRLSWAWET
jgi:hypothetical protein